MKVTDEYQRRLSIYHLKTSHLLHHLVSPVAGACAGHSQATTTLPQSTLPSELSH